MPHPHVLPTSCPPPSFSSSSYLHQRLLHGPRATRTGTDAHRKRRSFCFRFPSSRASTFRLLGAAVCACSLFHFLVHLFVSDLFDLLSPAPVHLHRKEYARNLTWHVGPTLKDDDRRAILVYSSRHLPTAGADAALSAHPRVVWLPEQLLQRHLAAQRAAHRTGTNMADVLRHLYNCSHPALPLLLQVLNEEAAARGEAQFCVPRSQRSSSSSRCKPPSSASCSSHGGGGVKGGSHKVRKDVPKCRKVTRRQLRTFCLQHHLAVRLTDASWRLRHVTHLPLTPGLKVVHLTGRPVLTRNETRLLHFSSRTHRLSRLYHSVLVTPRHRAFCEQLRDDLDWLSKDDPSSLTGGLGGWVYQRFPAACFEGPTAESGVLEVYNFLDIYVSDRIRKRAQEVGNVSRTSGPAHDPSGESFVDPCGLTEEETLIQLRDTYNQTCGGGKT